MKPNSSNMVWRPKKMQPKTMQLVSGHHIPKHTPRESRTNPAQAQRSRVEFKCATLPEPKDELVRLRESRKHMHGEVELFQQDRDNRKQFTAKVAKHPYSDSKPTCRVMFVGTTGSDKHAVVQSMLNNLMSVEYTEPFRYKLPADCTANGAPYVTYHIPMTKGSALRSCSISITSVADNVVLQQYQDPRGLKHIDAIFLVMKASQTSIDEALPYLEPLSNSAFKGQVFLIFTASDGSTPPTLDSLKRAMKKLGVKLVNWFAMNNLGCGLPDSDTNKETHKVHFDLTARVFNDIFTALPKPEALFDALSEDNQQQQRPVFSPAEHVRDSSTEQNLTAVLNQATEVKSDDSEDEEKQAELRPSQHASTPQICPSPPTAEVPQAAQPNPTPPPSQNGPKTVWQILGELHKSVQIISNFASNIDLNVRMIMNHMGLEPAYNSEHASGSVFSQKQAPDAILNGCHELPVHLDLSAIEEDIQRLEMSAPADADIANADKIVITVEQDDEVNIEITDQMEDEKEIDDTLQIPEVSPWPKTLELHSKPSSTSEPSHGPETIDDSDDDSDDSSEESRRRKRLDAKTRIYKMGGGLRKASNKK